MRTRVRAVYEPRFGRDAYAVEQLRDYDYITAEGDKVCYADTGGMRWRHVAWVLDQDEAVDMAKALAHLGKTDAADRVVAEFGGVADG